MSLTTCGNCDEKISEDDIKETEEKEEEDDDAGLETEAALLQGEGDDGITVRARTFKYVITDLSSF